VHLPVGTACTILTNFIAFGLELSGGDAFVPDISCANATW
jgi:hypothetical protein